jgi:hypothetical protein
MRNLVSINFREGNAISKGQQREIFKILKILEALIAKPLFKFGLKLTIRD